MADNVAITAGAGTSIATDDVGGVQFQRVKNTFGADGTATDVTSTTPMPVYDPDITVTGTITATDAVVGTPALDGTLLSGTPTAASYVGGALQGGDAGLTLYLTGTFGGGTYYFEASVDATSAITGKWVTLTGKRQGSSGTTTADSATVESIWKLNVSGFAWFRVRVKGATAPSLTVTWNSSAGEGTIAMNSALPAGTNAVGTVTTVNPSGTATQSGVSLLATSFTIIALNANRKGLYLYNDSVNVLYVKLDGGTATTTNYSFQLAPGGYWEMAETAIFTNAIVGISAVASGIVKVTEVA